MGCGGLGQIGAPQLVTLAVPDWPVMPRGLFHLRLEAVRALDRVVRQVQLPQLGQPLQALDRGQPAKPCHARVERKKHGGGADKLDVRKGVISTSTA